jgi:hypothetical protein
VAVDIRAEMQRPVPLVLAAIALVGWIVAIWAISSGASDRHSAEAQLNAAEAARQQIIDELARHTRAAGSLDEVREQLGAVQAEVATATKDRDTLSTQLDSLRHDLETAKTGLAYLCGQTQQATDNLGVLKQEQVAAEQRLGRLRPTWPDWRKALRLTPRNWPTPPSAWTRSGYKKATPVPPSQT